MQENQELSKATIEGTKIHRELLSGEITDKKLIALYWRDKFLAEVAENQPKLTRSLKHLANPDVNPRTKKIAENFIDARISHAFNYYGDRVTFDMFAIPKIFSYCREKLKDGHEIADTVFDAVEKFRLQDDKPWPVH